MRVLIGGLLALAMAACGPIYNTEYSYSPPADPQGRACIAQCNASQTLCRSNADLKAENERLRCDGDANAEYDHCLARAVNDSARAQCTRRSCAVSADSSMCENDFRVCFQTCGGVVNVQQVCTFNCPK